MGSKIEALANRQKKLASGPGRFWTDRKEGGKLLLTCGSAQAASDGMIF